MASETDLILSILHMIPVEPETIRRTELLGSEIQGNRRINLLSRIYALPGFVLIAEDHDHLCFLSEESKQKSIEDYMRWMNKETVDGQDMD